MLTGDKRELLLWDAGAKVLSPMGSRPGHVPHGLFQVKVSWTFPNPHPLGLPLPGLVQLVLSQFPIPWQQTQNSGTKNSRALEPLPREDREQNKHGDGMSEGLSIPKSPHFPCSETEMTSLSLIPVLMCAGTFVQCSHLTPSSRCKEMQLGFHCAQGLYLKKNWNFLFYSSPQKVYESGS